MTQLTEDSECPSCGNKTLTKRGITVKHKDGTTGGSTWLSCLNCDYEEYEDDAREEADA